ncbi:MAG TPA: dephospho-CoA kinase [Microthrixaceae bacterium]|nr:dephospho-CoA kinase [Microthrixaceae bacterium]
MSSDRLSGYFVAMLLIGLTGGIGSGKSTVSAAFAKLGAVVVDADAIVHECQRAGTDVFKAMVERFGTGIVAENGELDRAGVAEIVFADPKALEELGKIVHPRVQSEIFSRVEAQKSTDNVVILDVPLLVESGWSDLAGTIVVDLHPDLAVQRLVEFREFSEEDARNRISNQVSREKRLAAASFVIDNSGTLESLEAEIDRAWEWIESLRPT